MTANSGYRGSLPLNLGISIFAATLILARASHTPIKLYLLVHHTEHWAAKMSATIATTLQTATEKLGGLSHSPRLDAEILLSLATGKTKTHFRAWPEKHLSVEEQSHFQNLLEQRLIGHPIAYLTGTREFWSREFMVTPNVLIPRPETELLVELALQLIDGWETKATSEHRVIQIADLGTGSGAIAITLGLELTQAAITALDLSLAALALAEQNASRLGANNIRFIQSDWFSALPAQEHFDLIVSNPPYIAENDPHLQLGDVRFEPSLALSSGPDGLDAIRRIVNDAPNRLKPGGWLLFEHGYEQADKSRELLQAAGYEDVASFPDLQAHLRVSAGRIGRGGFVTRPHNSIPTHLLQHFQHQ